jgi:hypothetical protein
MWLISIPFAAFLLYGLATGRVTIGALIAWSVYERAKQPRRYWAVCALHAFFVAFGIFGTFRPDLVGIVVRAAAPILLVVVVAILVTGLRRKPRDGYLGEGP